jgi:Flp pilus assembly protein TadD
MPPTIWERINLVLNPPRGEWSPWLLGLFLVVAISLTYSNTLHGAFQYDDYSDIKDNMSIRRLWPLRDVFFVAGRGFMTRPVANLTFALNYAMGGLNPFYYHLTNLGIHLGASLAFLGVVRRTLSLPQARERYASHISTLSLVIAAIWALHPLQTESVSYITQRYESLMGLFVLLTFYCLLRTTESPSPWKWEGLASLCCLLALGSKEVAVSAPILVLLFDRTFITGSFRKAWGEHKVLYGGLLIAGLCFAFVQVYAMKRTWAGVGGQSETVSWWLYALNQPAVILHYLRLVIWPHPLSFDYFWPVVRGTKQLLPSILAVCTLLALTLWGVVRMPKMAFLATFFFFILAPTSSVMPILDLAVEHRMYLPTAPVIVMIVIGIYQLITRNNIIAASDSSISRLLIAVIVACSFSALCILTYLRNEDYQNPIDLWKSAVAQAPNNPRAHHNYAYNLSEAGFLDEALRQYAITIDLAPNIAIFQSNYGVLLGRVGRYQEALDHLRRAVQLDPKDPRYFINLGGVLWNKGSVDSAVICFEEASKVDPRAALPYTAMASIVLAKGQTTKALDLAGKAIALEPFNPLCRFILGAIYLKIGDHPQARASFQSAISLDLNPAKTASNAGWVYHEYNWDKEAIAFLRQSMVLDPGLVESQVRLAWILATCPDDSVRNGAEALAIAEKLLNSQPFRSPKLLDLLAVSLGEMGRFPEARAALREAVAQSKDHKESWLPDLEKRLALFERDQPFREYPGGVALPVPGQLNPSGP